MSTLGFSSLFFLAAAGLFSVLAIRDYVKRGKSTNPAQKTWMLISIIFTIVGIALLIV